jgi:hypothetical protein
MSNLKVKFKLHGLEFELEGDEGTVKEEFANFKSFISADLLSKVNIVAPQITTITTDKAIQQIGQVQDTTAIDLSEFPILKEVVKKDLPKTESDWILIYGLYSSDFGENPFSEKDIRSQYEATGRNKSSRLGNITNNIKTLLNKEYFKMHNDNQYILKEKGLEYAKQILQGNSISKTVNRTSSSKGTVAKEKPKKESADGNIQTKSKKLKPSKSKESISIDKHLNLRAQGKKSFKDFYEEKKPSSSMEFNTAAIYYLSQILELDTVNASQVYTCYKEVNQRPPVAFIQSLRDTASLKGYIDSSDVGNLTIPSRGVNFVEHDLPKNKNGK